MSTHCRPQLLEQLHQLDELNLDNPLTLANHQHELELHGGHWDQ
jgi:hypothetical protein